MTDFQGYLVLCAAHTAYFLLAVTAWAIPWRFDAKYRRITHKYAPWVLRAHNLGLVAWNMYTLHVVTHAFKIYGYGLHGEAVYRNPVDMRHVRMLYATQCWFAARQWELLDTPLLLWNGHVKSVTFHHVLYRYGASLFAWFMHQHAPVGDTWWPVASMAAVHTLLYMGYAAGWSFFSWKCMVAIPQVLCTISYVYVGMMGITEEGAFDGIVALNAYPWEVYGVVLAFAVYCLWIFVRIWFATPLSTKATVIKHAASTP